MGQLDARSNLGFGVSISQTTNHNGTETGSSVEVADFMGAAAVAIMSSYTDGDQQFTLQHSDDDSTWADVPSSQLDGSFDKLDDDSKEDDQLWVGYKGNKRYLRVTATSTDEGSTGSGVEAYILKYRPLRGPAQEAAGS